MFERFTNRARRVVALAGEEAARWGHDHLATEHILLGLLHEEEGVAARVLGSRGITYDSALARVIEVLGADAASAASRDADALAAIGIDLDAVRAAVEEEFGEGALDRPRRGRRSRGPHKPMAKSAKTLLDLSLREALQLGHSYIGTEHMLLAILRMRQGVAFDVIEGLAPPATALRQDVLARLDEHRRGA